MSALLLPPLGTKITSDLLGLTHKDAMRESCTVELQVSQRINGAKGAHTHKKNAFKGNVFLPALHKG